jgi:ataxia telangiectasia mutated family protein
LVVKAGASKLKSKTVEAVVDHITQTLPNADGEYCEPLTQHYFKALSSVFEPKSNVERLKATAWSEVVEFCLRGISRYSDDGNGEASALPLRSPGVESSYASGLLAKSASSNGRGHSKGGSVSRQSIEDLLNALLSLVSAPNAPLLQSSQEITSGIIRFLHLQGSAVSTLHQLAFSILNAVLSCIREDRSAHVQSVAEEVIPIITRFWQGKNLAKDEMLNSVRDEMLILLFIVNLHLERNIMDGESVELPSKLEDLLEVMTAEYSRRLDRDPLHMEDIDMIDFGAAVVDATPFRLHAFQLRPYNTRAERNWASLQIISLLQRLVSLVEEQRRLASNLVDIDNDNHPRKRQRTTHDSGRLLHPMKAKDIQIRLASLQILPFVLQYSELSTSVLVDLLSQLTSCAVEKEDRIASWALLAIAR